jgi:hypothetical protein
MTRKLRGLIAVPLMAIAALLAGILPASADTGPYGFPILYADSANIVHQCGVIGAAPGYLEAVVCVDIDTGTDSSGYYATGAVEAYCQVDNPPTGFPPEPFECQAIHIDGLLANADSGATTSTYNCSGDCGTGRTIFYVAGYTYTGGHDCTSSSGHDVWAEALGDTSITLGNRTVYVSTYFANDNGTHSTGHYWVCP